MYHPYKRIDNEYYQPWKVGDKVWYKGVRYKVVEVDNYFNKRNRRQARKFYWLQDLRKPRKDRPMYRRTVCLLGEFTEPAYPHDYNFIGHGLSADELDFRK